MLLTSELVTNAVIHPTAPPDSTIGLRISVRANGVRVEVDDQGDGFDPAARAVATGRGGRGLFLVDQCAASWGARRTEADRGEPLLRVVRLRERPARAHGRTRIGRAVAGVNATRPLA